MFLHFKSIYAPTLKEHHVNIFKAKVVKLCMDSKFICIKDGIKTSSKNDQALGFQEGIYTSTLCLSNLDHIF